LERRESKLIASHNNKTLALSVPLAVWPVRRLPKWVDRVNEALTEKERTASTRSLTRSVPFGSEQWIAETVKRCRWESTIGPQGRPKKLA